MLRKDCVVPHRTLLSAQPSFGCKDDFLASENIRELQAAAHTSIGIV
jgi:hypothetical protein